MSMPVRCPQYPIQAPNSLGAQTGEADGMAKELVVGLGTMVVVLAVALGVVLVRSRCVSPNSSLCDASRADWMRS